MPETPRRTWRKRLIAISVGITLAPVALELVIRLVPFDLPPGIRGPHSLHDLRFITQPHGKLLYAMRAGVENMTLATSDYRLFDVTTRVASRASEPSIGFRGTFPDEPAWAVLVGDSFAMGWGVNDDSTFASIAGRSMGRRILNFGVSGYGPQQSRIALTDFALAYTPKIVLWCFYPNDIMDSFDFRVQTDSGRLPEKKAAWRMWMNRYWATYKLYRYLGKWRSSARRVWSGDTLEYAFSCSWKVSLDLRDSRTKAGAKLIAAEIDTFSALARQHEFEPVLIAMPFREQVYYEEYRQVDSDVEPLEHYERAYRAVLDRARSRNIHTLDMKPILRDQKHNQIYFWEDPHLTALGNRITGEHLAAWLRERGLAR